MLPDIIVWPDAALYLISNTAQADKYISSPAHTFTLCLFQFLLPEKLLQPFCSAYISSLPCLYFLLFCRLYFLPPQIEGRSEDIFPCQAGGREGGYSSLSNYPLPNKCLTSRPPSLPLLLQQFTFSFWKLDIWETFAYQIRKLSFEFYLDLKRKAPWLNSIRREILAAGNFHFKLGNCRGAKLRQYSK